MHNGQLDNVLRYIRSLAAVRQTRDLPDRELLERFATDHDQVAFTAIVERHGPLVFGVCRRILRNEHDAEDACQATFLVLTRKATTIRKRDSLGSWLHGVAYRVARKLHADVRRRAGRDVTEAVVTQPDASVEMTWREGLVILDEELNRLPATYRSALILCYLESRTQGQVARELGCSLGTLRGRLERARECLRKRLLRRGVGLPGSTTLLAVLISTGVEAAMPPMLSVSTVKAVARLLAGQALARVVSASVANLTEGVLTTMSVIRVKTIASLVLTASLLAASAGALTGFARSEKETEVANQPLLPAPAIAQDAPPQGQPAAPTNKDANDTLTVRGRVHDADGKPFADAKLYLTYRSPRPLAYPVRATSGADGRFEFTFARSELDRSVTEEPGIQVMAVAKGHGCDWAAVGADDKDGEVSLRLVKDVPISGRILDPDGKPVAGARLTVRYVFAPKGDDLGDYVKEYRMGFGIAFAKDWAGPLPGPATVLTTGADGRFKLAGAGRERVVHFRVEGPGIASSYLSVMTRTAEAVKTPDGLRVFGASFDYVANLSRPVRGVVRDKETGKPLAGVSVVDPYDPDGPSALTDKEGRYELLGLGSSSLEVKPPADGLHYRLSVEVKHTPGLGALTCDIELPRGLTVRGRVTDKATGKPVAQARVEYHPLYGNTYANQLTRVSSPCAETTTAADGSYTLTVLRDQGLISVAAPRRDAYMPALVTLKERKDFFKAPLAEDRLEDSLLVSAGSNSIRGFFQASYHALVLLEPGEKEQGMVKNVALQRPLERKGRVVGPDDQPLTGVTACGLTWLGVETLKASEFSVRGINPRANRPLVFFHKEKNLGFYVKELRGEKSEPLTVKLQPCGSASGRIVDPDGQPLAGLRLGVQGRALPIAGDAGGGCQLVTTDKEGRFRAEGLVPGQDYSISEALNSVRSRLFAPVKDVEPGKHQDLGDIKADLDK